MATKKTSSGKGAESSPKDSEFFGEQSRQQFWAIVIFSAAIFISAVTLIRGQNVWQWIHNFFLGMFGWSAYLIAPILFYISISTALSKPLIFVGHKVWQSLLLICLLSGATQVFGSGIPNGNLLEKASSLFHAGIEGHGGGFISAIFGLPLMHWFGPLGAKITMILLIFLLFMVLTGGTLIDLFRSAQKPFKSIEHVYMNSSEKKKQSPAPKAPKEPKVINPIARPYHFKKSSTAQTMFFNVQEADTSEEENSEAVSFSESIANLKEKFLTRFKHQNPEAVEEPVISEPVDFPPLEPTSPEDTSFTSPEPKPDLSTPAPEESKPDTSFITSYSENSEEKVDSLSKEDQKFLYTLKNNTPSKPITLVINSSTSDYDSESDNTETSSEAWWKNSDDLADGFIPSEKIHFGQTISAEGTSSQYDYNSEEQPVTNFFVEEPKNSTSFDLGPFRSELDEESSFDSDSTQEYNAPQEQSQKDSAILKITPLSNHPSDTPEQTSSKDDSTKSAPQRRNSDFDVVEVSKDKAIAEGMTTSGASNSNGVPESAPEEPAYIKPPIEILNEIKQSNDSNLQEELRKNGKKLIDTLSSFGVKATIDHISRGPAVTRYEIQPAPGVKISKITNLADDIALSFAASGIRIEAPIPNKPAVGIEVPNKVVSTVSIREIIDSPKFQQAKSPLTVALGRDIAGQVTITDLAKMPHTLIAGSTGSGKSVCINSLIVSMLYHSTPDEVKLLLIDPKMVELGIYNGIPHLLIPVVTDPKKAAGALSWAVNEMLNRYQYFKDYSVRDMAGFNRAAEKNGLKPMPHIVIIIDELADLMMAAPGEVEDSICRLAQMARAAGMHLVIATQRPSVDVITGVIKANIPSRIAFAVSSQIDSRTILDSGGAEKLLGRGDMLFSPVGSSKPTRIQGCFVTDGEVERIIEFIKRSSQPQTYDEHIIEEIDRHAVSDVHKKGSRDDNDGFSDDDEMLPSAIETVVQSGQASTSMLQRKLKLGYARASRLMDTMEERGIIGPFEGSKPRQVLISKERWIEMKMVSAAKAEDNRRNY